MESEFIKFLNGLGGIPFGTIIAIIVMIATGIVTIYKVGSYFKKLAKDDAEKELKNQALQDTVNTMNNSVNVLQESINQLSNKNNQDNLALSSRIDELHNKINNLEKTSNEGDSKLLSQLEKQNESIETTKVQVGDINKKTNLILESDKETKKSYITDKYYECKDKGFIEIHSLQTLEAIYSKYLEENGNTFIGSLMDEMRQMPHEINKANKEK